MVDGMNETVDSINLKSAMETPFWRFVWAGEPERLIDVRMTYEDLKIICDMIDKARNDRPREV